MRKIIIAALMGAAVLPSAAMAQNGELRRDRQDIREERRDVRDARRNGDIRDVRREQRDVREARQEYREDRRDFARDDWRGYRNTNRQIYRGGNFNANFRYQSFRPGVRLGVGYYAPRYYINDFSRFRLPRPGFNQRYVRHYNDVLLVDVRTGFVINVLRGFYW